MDMPTPRHPWSSILAASHRARFTVDAVLPEHACFDFGRPLLPESMTGAGAMPGLDAERRLLLGHVRAHGYLAMFGLVEAFILPFVVDHVAGDIGGELGRTQALLGFAAEEAKHIQLFERFSRVFTRDFAVSCAVIGPADAIAEAVLAQPQLAVALLILQIEWMTQQHWVASVRGDERIDPAFSELLRVHWMEEAQHARLDAIVVTELAARSTAAEIDGALDAFAGLIELLDGALRDQVALDLDAFERADARRLSPAERDAFVRTQHASQRRVFLLDGLRHPAFLRTAHELSPRAPGRIAAIADRLH
jgi:hypothetical protein